MGDVQSSPHSGRRAGVKAHSDKTWCTAIMVFLVFRLTIFVNASTQASEAWKIAFAQTFPTSLRREQARSKYQVHCFDRLGLLISGTCDQSGSG